jgi:pyrroline-5-carboxylate reductase
MKIAIIGAGNIGGAIARGLINGGIIEAKDLTISNPSSAKVEWP